MDQKQLIDNAVNKVEDLGKQVIALKAQLDQSEQARKDLFKLDEAKEAIKTQIAELMVIDWGKEKKSVVDSLIALQKHTDELEGRITEQAFSGKNKVKSAPQQILDYLQGAEYKQLIDLRKAGKKMSNEIGFEVKAISTGDIDAVGTDSIPFSLMTTEPGVAKHPNNPTLYYSLVSKGTTVKEFIQWLERNTVVRGADMVAQNGKFPESSITWVEKYEKVKKIADYAVVTNESLEDFEYTMSEIMEVLQFNIPNKRDNQLFNGDGQGNNLLGIDQIAKAFAVPTGIDAINSVDNYHVLATAVLQVILGNKANDANTIGFAPNGIVLNHVDFHNMKMLRDNDGRWLYPELWMPNPQIAGVPVYTTTRMTVGSFHVGDFSKAKYFTRRGMAIRMWDQNGEDALYDRVTFTCSERGVQRIKTPEQFAFVKGTFAAARALLGNNA